MIVDLYQISLGESGMAGQKVNGRMGTYRITAVGKEVAGFGQVVKGFGRSLVTILRHRT